MPEPGILPPFPTDDAMLDAIEHSLDYRLEHDQEAADAGDEFPFKGAGADYPLSRLLDFTAGTLDHDDPRVVTLLEDEWIGGVETTVDYREHYTEKDVIRALIGEVRRLRGDGGPNAQQAS